MKKENVLAGFILSLCVLSIVTTYLAIGLALEIVINVLNTVLK